MTTTAEDAGQELAIDLEALKDPETRRALGDIYAALRSGKFRPKPAEDPSRAEDRAERQP